MPTRSKKQIEKALRKKGFVEQQGDHHYFIYHTFSGKRTGVFTKTSHTPKMKDISEALFAQMANQCKLSPNNFCNLVDCPLSRNAYETILKNNHDI